MMKPQVNSRLIRLISVVLVIASVCFLFSYLLELEQRNTLLKEQEEFEAQSLLVKQREQQKKEQAERELVLENQRKQKLLESRAVLEPGNATPHSLAFPFTK